VFHPADLALRRQYAQATVRRRLHQPVFRERVLLAYSLQCALCGLRHPELLDAAHIKEDSEGGQPVVPNGVPCAPSTTGPSTHRNSASGPTTWCRSDATG
jgi:predicted restriction endonuclease